MSKALSPDLATSLQEIKTTAQSLQDLDEWLTKNPQALTGELHLPPEYEVTVNISYMPGRFIERITETGELPLTVNLTISAPKDKNVLLAKEIKSCEWVPALYFSHEYSLDLALTDWALATAWATGLCLRQNAQVKLLENAVAAGLAVHFPQTPLAVLRDMQALDLLPMTDANMVDTRGVIDMLFASRNEANANEVPMDLV